MLDSMLDVLRAEFSDVPDVAQTTRIAVRLLLAALLGGLLGYEREKSGKAAGIRTHMLVAIGSAMFALVPSLAGMTIADMSRVIQGIVTGVGFLGAGAIIKQRTEADVQGLTTAAGIWLTAAIGIACGLGRESTALLSTLLALVVLSIVPRLFGQRAGDDDGGRGKGGGQGGGKAAPLRNPGSSEDADATANERG